MKQSTVKVKTSWSLLYNLEWLIMVNIFMLWKMMTYIYIFIIRNWDAESLQNHRILIKDTNQGLYPLYRPFSFFF